MKTEIADFGAGCFWGVEVVFRKLPGVWNVQVGYEGGDWANPTYEDVCTGVTGHAEVVRVEYDPTRIRYRRLLEVFFESHDPTTRNRQGPDYGPQYRSVIFYHTPEQQSQALAEKCRRDESREYVGPIVTAIEAAGTFYRAEEHHQRYFEKHGINDVCHSGNGKKQPAIQ